MSNLIWNKFSFIATWTYFKLNWTFFKLNMTFFKLKWKRYRRQYLCFNCRRDKVHCFCAGVLGSAGSGDATVSMPTLVITRKIGVVSVIGSVGDECGMTGWKICENNEKDFQLKELGGKAESNLWAKLICFVLWLVYLPYVYQQMFYVCLKIVIGTFIGTRLREYKLEENKYLWLQHRDCLKYNKFH